MRAALLTLSLLAVLGGCGGVIEQDGVTAGRFAVLTDGSCLDLGSNVGCLDSTSTGTGGTGGTTTTGDTTGTVPPPPPVPAPPPAPPETLLTPEEGGCWFTGGGTFGKGATRDSFGGNAMTMKDKAVRGEWEHVDHTNLLATTVNGQNLFHGQVKYIACKKFPSLSGPQVPKAYPNYINFGGVGKFNHIDGYLFDVKAFDHGEGGIHFDRYVIDIFEPGTKKLILHADGQVTTQDPSNKLCQDDVKVTSDLAWVKLMGCLSGGNLQIHPPNTGHPY